MQEAVSSAWKTKRREPSGCNIGYVAYVGKRESFVCPLHY
jgi:hypothetical protein